MSALSQLLSDGLVEPVTTNSDIPEEWLRQAERHLAAARTVADVDPAGGIMLAYQAARISIAAVLLDTGHRVRSRTGSHQVLARFGQDLARRTGEPAFAAFDNLRRSRSQYDFRPDLDDQQEGSDPSETSRLLGAIEAARAIQQACSKALS